MAIILTVAGGIPFFGLVIAMVLLEPPSNSTAALWLQTYSAVILSFLGGIRWGLAIAEPSPSSGTLALSVSPALAGWAILPPAIVLMPSPLWFLVYAGLFGLQFIWDINSARMPVQFKPLRLGASLVATVNLVAAWVVQASFF
jgi:hypothetical protein